jgi:uncharacterized protein (TIGR02231 family)
MIQLLFPLVLCAPLQVEEPLPVASTLAEVTVFPGSALVRRTAAVPAGGGSFRVDGLPWSMDPGSVRVRCVGGHVLGIETRERHARSMPEERVETLRTKLRGLERELGGVHDESAVLEAIASHLNQLLKAEASNHVDDVSEGRATPEAWERNIAFLSEQLATNRRGQREAGWRAEELEAQIQDVRLELGSAGGGVYLRDVIVDVAGEGARGATLDVEYLVSGAGWRPKYDLRTASDARSVELSYRAEVWQQTGEDWDDVTLLLSTSRPQMGAEGPEPQVRWIGLEDPRRKGGAVVAARAPAADGVDFALGRGESEGMLRTPVFASVQSEGLSVRFRLAARESIESRDQPTTVLVGQSRLDVEAEYYVVPARDENVWLRGRTKNSTEWTMLPGVASVYFGADFIGHATLDSVQPGAELTLHLGPDPALTVERVRTEDQHKEPGILGSRVSRTEAWRVTLENHGAAAARAGVARVFVQEILPKSRDERLKVELLSAQPKASTAERWAQDREEKGVLTWALDIPKGGAAEVLWRMRVSHPKGTRIR